MAEFPWGWNRAIVSPVTRAHLTNGRSGRNPWSSMSQMIRRCTGLRPSRTSGRARDVMTDIA